VDQHSPTAHDLEGANDDDQDATQEQQGSALLATQGTIDDDQRADQDTTPDPTFTIRLPFLPQDCRHCRRGRYRGLELKDFVLHHTTQHSDLPIEYVCNECEKIYEGAERRHAALCHIPKCPGRKAATQPVHTCSACPMTFDSSTGLSQHERHVHPALRNAKRTASATQVPTQTRPIRSGRAFSADEVSRMLDMELINANDPDLVARMAERFSKTGTQIRSKRREPGYKKRLEERRSLREVEIIDLSSDEEDDVFLPALDEPGESEETEIGSNGGAPEGQEAVAEEPLPDEMAVPADGGSDSSDSEKSTNSTADDKEDNWRKKMLSYIINWNTGDLLPEGQALALMIKDAAVDASQENMDKTYNKFVESLGRNGRENDDGGRRKKKRTAGRKGRRSWRKYCYARTQELFKKNPKLLAKHARQGTDFLEPAGKDVDREDIKTLYGKLWESKPTLRMEDRKDENTPETIDPETFISAITAPEVKYRLGRVKNASAPGPDRIKKEALLDSRKHKLISMLFNVILVTGILPTDWSVNRTTLIPKEGKDATKAESYRPLTISSMVSRLFWGIVDQRLRGVVKLHPRQKGFVKENGGFANVKLLEETVSHMKRNGGGVGVQLDITKAFDTVPHEAIEWALRRKGLPEVIVRLVMDSYKEARTVIDHPDGPINVNIRRGVKQGDPLSPFLFCLVLEQLLELLQEAGGYEMAGQILACLAFADDLFLFSLRVLGATKLLDITIDYLESLGMGLALTKCFAFQIEPTKDSWYLKDPNIGSRGVKVPTVEAGECLSYLGVKFSLWEGITFGASRKNFTEMIKRVKKLALKPAQKLTLLQTYLVPHYLHELILAELRQTPLREMDNELRVAVRDIMHLPNGIATGVFYCKRRDGGLGLLRLEQIVPRIALSIGRKMEQSKDPLLRALTRNGTWTARGNRLANSIRMRYPCTQQELNRYRIACYKKELQDWADLKTQGRAVPTLIDDRIGNAFLQDMTLLKPCRLTTAIQMRTNTAGNRTSLNRAIPQEDINCRKCRLKPETLAHILGECTHTKGARIKRHDEIKHLVANEAQRKGATVTVEPGLTLPDGTRLKPDLVIGCQEGVFVVDVTVRHEDGNHLERASAEKKTKYEPLLPQLKTAYNAVVGDVIAVVVGTRGAMPKRTVADLRRIGISGRHLKTISLIALRSSIELYHAFLDYDGAV
jgi:Reverse transcriptase (RNA-dependent DNA polymerase)